jgi:hypothetical protein
MPQRTLDTAGRHAETGREVHLGPLSRRSDHANLGMANDQSRVCDQGTAQRGGEVFQSRRGAGTRR